MASIKSSYQDRTTVLGWLIENNIPFKNGDGNVITLLSLREVNELLAPFTLLNPTLSGPIITRLAFYADEPASI
ncbi:hypothetical protein [Azospirillum endophyticum]